MRVTLGVTRGLEEHTSMTTNCFHYCHTLLLVYSLEEEDSLYCLNDWVAGVHMHNSSDHVLLALWGNKSDSYMIALTWRKQRKPLCPSAIFPPH